MVFKANKKDHIECQARELIDNASEDLLFKNFHLDIGHIKGTIKSSDLNKNPFAVSY
jgi:hypothetical protein